MRRLYRVPLAAVILLVGLTACARNVTLSSEPGQTYAVSVVNELSHPMIVSFDDGTGARLLGTVGANRTERFVLAGTTATTVSIVAHDEGDTQTIRRTVALRAGDTVEVRLN